jgi:hypothetical protein
MQVGIAGLNTQNSAAQNYRAKNQRNKTQDIAFKRIVAEVAKDSQDVRVEKNVKQFFAFMRKTVRQAQAGDKKANKTLRGLIGRDAAKELVQDKKGFTQRADQTTKVIPLSGLGTRGAEIRNKITNTLGMKETHKAVMPLPAVLGKNNGRPVRLNTVTNEFLHMMQAKVLSPFEKLNFIKSEKSDGDLAVIVKGIKQGLVPTNKPAVLTYTDDIGSHGHKDYKNLVSAAKKEKPNSKTEIISVGFLATKEETAGKLGTFLPEGGAFKVFEKPTMEKLDELVPGEGKIMTNIGKTLFTPKGLQNIEHRAAADPMSLTKMDKGEPKLHVTEGALRPAGEKGALKVIPKDGQFSDVGNGTVFTDKMVEIAHGEMKHVFPEALEKQIHQNVKLAADGKSATLDYGKHKVVLPTSKE